MDPLDLTKLKKTLGSVFCMPLRDMWGYALFCFRKKCFCETHWSVCVFKLKLKSENISRCIGSCTGLYADILHSIEDAKPATNIRLNTYSLMTWMKQISFVHRLESVIEKYKKYKQGFGQNIRFNKDSILGKILSHLK